MKIVTIVKDMICRSLMVRHATQWSPQIPVGFGMITGQTKKPKFRASEKLLRFIGKIDKQD
jgi:hypothetical protein